MQKLTLSAKELAEILGIHQNTVYNMAQRNEIPSFKMGKRVLFYREEIEKFIIEKVTGKSA